MYITLPMPVSLIPSLTGAKLFGITEIDKAKLNEVPVHVRKAWNEVTIIDARLKQPYLSTGWLIIALKPQRQIPLNQQSLKHNNIPKNIIERAIINDARAGDVI